MHGLIKQPNRSNMQLHRRSYTLLFHYNQKKVLSAIRLGDYFSKYLTNWYNPALHVSLFKIVDTHTINMFRTKKRAIFNQFAS